MEVFGRHTLATDKNFKKEERFFKRLWMRYFTSWHYWNLDANDNLGEKRTLQGWSGGSPKGLASLLEAMMKNLESYCR